MSKLRWSIASSIYLLRTPWLNIKADDCVTADGTPISPYYLIESPDSVNVLAFTSDERLILVRQYRHGLNGMSIELPGGYMDENDASLSEAAARELREETGFRSESLKHLVTLSIDPGRYTNRAHFFCAYNAVAGLTEFDATETIETLLLSREEATRLAATGFIADAAHAAAILIALSSLAERSTNSMEINS